MAEPNGHGSPRGPEASGKAERRHELAAFLRSRRERITPEDAGLPGGYRRRTAGLRREEVAQLSGVGVTWYTWLEQGRPIRASVQVLEAVARTLQLDAIERQHLFRLAEVPDTTHPDEQRPGAAAADPGRPGRAEPAAGQRGDRAVRRPGLEPRLRGAVPAHARRSRRRSGTRCCTCSPGPTAAA